MVYQPVFLVDFVGDAWTLWQLIRIIYSKYKRTTNTFDPKISKKNPRQINDGGPSKKDFHFKKKQEILS